MSASGLHRQALRKNLSQQLVTQKKLTSLLEGVGELPNGYRAVLCKLDGSLNWDGFIEIFKHANRTLKSVEPAICQGMICDLKGNVLRKTTYNSNIKFEEASRIRKVCHQIFNQMKYHLTAEDKERISDVIKQEDITEPVLIMQYLKDCRWVSDPDALSLKSFLKSITRRWDCRKARSE